MNYSSRLWLYGPFAALALIAIAVCATWYSASSALAEKFAKLNGREATPGLVLRYAPPEMGGFPFRVDAVFKDFRATIQGKNGPIEYRTENFALHRLTYGRQTLFEAAGQQSLRWRNDKGEQRALSFVPGGMQASAIEDKVGLSRFDLDIVGIASPEVKGKRFQFHIRRDPKADLLNIVVKSDQLSASPLLQEFLGAQLGQGNFKGDVTQAGNFDGLRAGTIGWTKALAGWLASKGEVRPTR